MTDTKAYWKRRALRAEEALKTMRQMSDAHHAAEFGSRWKSACMSVCINEIREAIVRLEEDFPE